MKNNFIVLIFINLIFCQAEFQILTVPKNILQLSSNGGSNFLIKNSSYNNSNFFKTSKNLYSFNLIHYPSNIMLYNFSKDKYSISFLDYGFFEDRINDTIYKTFSAYEILANSNFNKKIRNHTLGLSIGLFHSSIYTYNSFGLVSSLGINSSYKKNTLSFSLFLENIGHIFKNYTAYNQKLPFRYKFSINKIFNKVSLASDVIYLNNFNEFQNILCFQFNPNDKVSLRISNTNNYKNLWLEDNKYNFISGLGLGIDINLKNTSISIGFLNLGVAGLVYGTSVKFLRK